MLEVPAVIKLCIFPPWHAKALQRCVLCICRRNDEEYYRMTEPVRTRNEVLMAAAQQQHDAAIQQWQKEYSLAVMEWESLQVFAIPLMLDACHCISILLPFAAFTKSSPNFVREYRQSSCYFASSLPHCCIKHIVPCFVCHEQV